MHEFWKSARHWLPGAIISLLAIGAILLFVDLQRFLEAIRSADYRLLLASLSISFLWLGIRAVAWRTLLRGRARLLDTFLTVCEGYLLNNFLPFRLGEIGRTFLLGRKSKLGFMEVLPTVILERVLDVAFAAALLLSAVPFVVGAAGAGRIALALGGVVLLGLVALYALVRKRELVLGLFQRFTGRWPGLQSRGGGFLAALFSGLSILTDGWLFVRALFWLALDWGVGVVQFYLLLRAFFPQAHLYWSLFALGALAFGNAIPSLPGAVGTFEGAMGGAVTLLGGDQSTALAAALTAHFFNYLISGIIGLYALSREGETLMGVYRQLRKRQEEK
jgi:uncharacterized protein (TIRG00374 family)